MTTKPYQRAALGALVVSLVGPAVAQAEEAHHPHFPNLLGLKAVAVEHVESGQNGAGAGVGLFVERAIVEDVLDVELSASRARVGEELVVPVDFIVKTPWWASHGVTVYSGAGVSLTYEEVGGESEYRPGLVAQTGVYLWPWEHYGVDVELDYNLLLKPELGHELNVAAGPIVRF